MKLEFKNKSATFVADFYEKDIEKPIFIFIHGALSSLSIWNLMYKNFLNHGNILIINLPGHQPSSLNWKEVHSLKDYTDLLYEAIIYFSEKFKQKILIGHSVGGMMAIILNSLYQKDFYKVISITPIISKNLGLLSPLNIPVNIFNKTHFFKDMLWYIKDSSLKELAKNHKDIFFEILVFFGIVNQNIKEEIRDSLYCFIEEIEKFDPLTLKSLVDLVDKEFKAKYSIFDIIGNGYNVLVIGADKDILVDKENHRMTSDKVNSYYVELDNAGHLCIIENHKEITEIIFSFLRN